MSIKTLVFSAGALVAIFSIGGCATTYQPKSFTGGFSETNLGPTSFKIAFSGNGFTSPERASDFAMLRAADKSIEDGCNYFAVMNESEGGSTSSFTTSTASFGRYGMWGNSITTPIFKPNSTLLVRCFTSQTAGNTLFDANFIAQSIREKYHLADAAPGGVASAPAPATTANATQKNLEAPNATAAHVAPPASNIAQQVLAAQRIAAAQGCGDVTAGRQGDFQASCTEGTLIIQCTGDSCRPTGMKAD